MQEENRMTFIDAPHDDICKGQDASCVSLQGVQTVKLQVPQQGTKSDPSVHVGKMSLS